jgi:hypothetical protein
VSVKMAVTNINIPIGLADIKIAGTALAHQADAAVFMANPEFQAIDLYDVPKYDQYLTGWDVQLKVTLDDENYQAIMQSLTAGEEIVDATTSATTGVKDGALLQRMRSKAKEIIIHPQALGADTSYDIKIFKAIAISGFQRTYGKEKGSWEVTFQSLHRTGDPKDAGAYFVIGDASGIV